MKKTNLLIISSIALLMPIIVGCSSVKELTKDEAIKFVNETYTSKEEKEGQLILCAEISKSSGLFENYIKVGKSENLKWDFDNLKPVDGELINEVSEDFMNCKFIKEDKKFKIESEENAQNIYKVIKDTFELPFPEDAVSGSVKFVMNYAENGYLSSMSLNIDTKLNYTSPGVLIAGELNGSISGTITYR